AISPARPAPARPSPAPASSARHPSAVMGASAVRWPRRGRVAMRIRLKGWRAWFIVAAAGVAAAYVAWATRRVHVPDIPRPGPLAYLEREVQRDGRRVAGRVHLEPRPAAAWGKYGFVLRAYRQPPEADVCFQVAADLDPTDGRWPYLIGAHLADANPTAAVE